MRKSLAIISASALIAAGGAAVAAVSTAGAATGTIYGCVATAGSKTINRVTSQSQPACASGYVPIQWQGTVGVTPPPSPSPTPTSPSPSPTSPSPSPTGKACVETDQTNCGPYSVPAEIPFSNGYNTYVGNQNAASGNGTLTAYDPGNWNVTANYPAGNGSVMAYPDAQQLTNGVNGNNDPLSGFSSITSDYSETMPHGSGTIAEAAYDIWTNYPQDIMVWNDVVGRCNAGAFGGTTLATGVTVGGQTYDVYRYGGAGAEIIFVLEGAGGAGTCAQQTSGSVDVLGVLNWVSANVTPITSVSQINYGWELCSTGGVQEDFTISAYDMKVTCASTGCMG